ncbi:MAG TPA: nitroreductase family protein, partial [Longimicrobium sp.]|nr:nitroreductase family protein [Longimicrobium sp.]
VIAARFARLAAKYESLAYSLCLKDTGVLMQTMYLVATAMGLAPCALGGGDADLFARASGLSYLVEGSVGEFLLGVPAAGDAAAPGEGA